MTNDDLTPNEAPVKPESPADKGDRNVPIGIARIREEWRETGMLREQPPAVEEIEPVVFPEVDGGAGVGDYTLDADLVKSKLALSQEAFDRVVASGELDSILIRSAEGETRRMFSESSVARFFVDSAIDPQAIERAALAMADRDIVRSVDDLRSEIDELRNTQSKILQQMKDILLLEVRNLKEQDRDLTSFVYELAEEIRKQRR